jgi:hypothetical protein
LQQGKYILCIVLPVYNLERLGQSKGEIFLPIFRIIFLLIPQPEVVPAIPPEYIMLPIQQNFIAGYILKWINQLLIKCNVL